MNDRINCYVTLEGPLGLLNAACRQSATRGPCRSSGLCRKQTAPALIAFVRTASFGYAVMKMMGMSKPN